MEHTLRASQRMGTYFDDGIFHYFKELESDSMVDPSPSDVDHIVMLKLKSGVTEEQIEDLTKGAATLIEIDGVLLSRSIRPIPYIFK